MQDAPAIGLPAIRSPLAAGRYPLEIRSLPERSGSRVWLDSLKEEIKDARSAPPLDSTIFHTSPAAGGEEKHHRSRDHGRTPDSPSSSGHEGWFLPRARHKGQPSFEGGHSEWLGEVLRRPAPPSCGLRM